MAVCFVSNEKQNIGKYCACVFIIPTYSLLLNPILHKTQAQIHFKKKKDSISQKVQYFLLIGGSHKFESQIPLPFYSPAQYYKAILLNHTSLKFLGIGCERCSPNFPGTDV